MTSKYRKISTIVIPAFFISIVLIAVSIKYFVTTKDEPLRLIKKEKIKPALERTASINKVMFKKFDTSRYKGDVTASVIHDATLLIEIKSDYFPDNDAALIRQKREAFDYYKKQLCRVPNFSNLVHLQNRFKDKYDILVTAEITQVDSDNTNLWQVIITPSDCN